MENVTVCPLYKQDGLFAFHVALRHEPVDTVITGLMVIVLDVRVLVLSLADAL